MIYQTKSVLHALMLANSGPTQDLRGYKTFRKGDWKEVPILEQPSLSIEWGGSFQFGQAFNPFESTFTLDLVTKCTEPRDPDLVSKKIELLLWDFDLTGDWGLIPFLRDNRSLQLPNSPYTVLITPRTGEVLIESNGDNYYSASCITTLECTSQS